MSNNKVIFTPNRWYMCQHIRVMKDKVVEARMFTQLPVFRQFSQTGDRSAACE
jgi:hypothetical protein